MPPTKKYVKKKPISPYVVIVLDGVWSKAYVDTGASSTLIADTLLSPSGKLSLEKYTGKVYDASGNAIPILGGARTNVVTSVGSLDTQVLVFKKTTAIN